MADSSETPRWVAPAADSSDFRWADPARSGFRVEYETGDNGRSATVTVRVGYAGLEADYQTVTIDDDRLPFTIRGEVSEGRVAHLHLAVRGRPVRLVDGEPQIDMSGPQPGEIEQRHLRSGGVVPAIKKWADLGRRFQGVPVEERGEFIRELPDRYPSIDAALDATAAAVADWAHSNQSGARGRTVGPEAEELLLRVVKRYRQLTAAGHKSPRKVIAGEENYTSEHIGRLLVKARKRGMLAPARPGRAGEARGDDRNTIDGIEF